MDVTQERGILNLLSRLLKGRGTLATLTIPSSTPPNNRILEASQEPQARVSALDHRSPFSVISAERRTASGVLLWSSPFHEVAYPRFHV